MAYRGKPILTIRLDREIIDRITACASSRAMTVSDILREAIAEYFVLHDVPEISPAPVEGQISLDEA